MVVPHVTATDLGFIFHVIAFAFVVPSLHAWFPSGVAVAVYVPASIADVVPVHVTFVPATPGWFAPLYVLFAAAAVAVFALSIFIVYVASFVTFELLSVAVITYVYVPAGVFAAMFIVVPLILI